MGKVCMGLCLVAGLLHADERPNILLITADTFRADHIGFDGYRYDTSPHLDSLSAEGVFFDHAYTTSGWTAPGLISIHTGLYAPAHGVDVRGRSLAPSVVTLAEALRGAGYRAPDIFFLTDIPNFENLGFDSWAERKQHVRDGDEILFRWLRQEAGASDAPFFLYYHYRDLHQPYAAGEPYESMFTENAFGSAWNPMSWVRRFLAGEKTTLVQREVMLPRDVIDFGAWDKPWVDAFYDAEVRKMDERLFGRLRRLLRELELDRNTIIVVSADHGEELLEDGLVGHVSTYKEGRLREQVIRIPLIFHAPGRVPSGLRVERDIVQAIDVMPTLLELAHVPIPEGVQGRSLVPLFEGNELSARPAFMETSGGGYTADLEQYARRTRAIRTERWKLLWHTPSDEVELYDLLADPQERENVASDYPQIADSLLVRLTRWVNDHPKIGPEPSVYETVLDGVAESVQVQFPASGDTFGYIGAGQTIQLHWSGDPHATYTVEYDIGQGAYHLDGVLTIESNTPSYGPFHEDFWNSLVLYNPWRFRVYPRGQPSAASDWVTFHLAASGDGSISWAGNWFLVAAAVSQTAGELADLARGLGLGLIDAAVWLAAIPLADVTAWALLAAIAGALVWPRLERFGADTGRAWAFVVVYVAIVYATIPVFPTLWGHLRELTGPGISHLGTIAVIVAAVVPAWRVTSRARADGQLWRLPLLLVVLALYGWTLHKFGRFPAERLHLLEYGLLAFLLVRALRRNLDAPAAYAWSLGLTAVIGFGDETIQWVLPQRYFELKDAGLNVVAGTLGLCLTALSGIDRTDT